MNGGGPRRRLAATGGAIALALAMALVLAPLAGDASAATTECAWQRHHKRVVKHVKRHGRVIKVVRIQHHWTCNPVLAPETPIPPPLQVPTPAPAPAPTPTPAPVVEPEANAVGVIADDHGKKSYSLSVPTARAGEIVVQLNNKGEDPHNLNIQREENGVAVGEPLKVPKTEPGQQTTEDFDLPAGTYRFYCSIAMHAMEGMEATFVVE